MELAIFMSRFYFDLPVLGVNVVYDEMIKTASGIEAIPQRPLFILLEQINLFDEKETPKYVAIEFSKENVDNLFDMLRNPEKAWEIYNNSTSNINSDVVQRISVKKIKDPSEKELYPDVWETRKIGLFDTNRYKEAVEMFKNTVFEEFVKTIPPMTEFQKRNNGFFNAKFTNKILREEKYTGKELDYFRYWDTIMSNMEERRKFCFLKQFIDPILNINEKEKIHEVPCVIYALEQYEAPKRIIDDLYRFHVCYGNVIKTKDLHMVLSANQIRLRISKVSFPAMGGFKITSDEYPKKNKQNENWPLVWLDYYKGHIMLHEDVKFPGSEIKVPFLRLLHWAFEEKIFIPMNAYEFSELTSHIGFSLVYKLTTKEILENTEEGTIFEKDCIPFEGKKTNSTRIKVYADFECSVDEQYHRPYCISYRFISDPSLINNKIELKGHYWGEDCGEKFLKMLQNTVYKISNREKHSNLNDSDKTFSMPWKYPAITVYFHNLRYDFTFLLRYLRNIKLTKKGNSLYQVKNLFGRGLQKVCFAFKDTLPLLQMSLKKAGESFLSKKQKKKVKKEAFPYELYTYSFFESHPSGWCTLEEFRAGFGNDKLLADFDANLPNLPSKIYDPQLQRIFYKEYAFFYCDQDVRVLYHVMNKFHRLLTASGDVEGINGNPPFGDGQSPFYHLTISSLAYDYFQKKAILEWKQVGTLRGNIPKMQWVPKFPIMMTRGLLRYIGHKTIRGGRVMTRDNVKWHYTADPNNPDSILVDYDGVSLYPSAISRLWLTEGEPILIKGTFSEKDFLENFTHPDAPEGEYKQYNDGWIHIYSLMCWKDRHFPSLCIKDEKTKLNEYQNFHGAVDTWVNAIDLFNLIEFQNATFYWDAAVVWKGPRHYECRSVIKELFEFRAKNKQHPIQLVTKLMMNSIYGKSALKPANFEEEIVDAVAWRKLGEEENVQWEKVDNWREKFNANAYRIKSFEYLDKEHIKVKYHQLDTSANFVPFGSNVLAMARRIIMRVMSLAEDMEELHPECAPGLFYTDTDSMHIRKDLLKYTEEAYMEKYGEPICGKNLCQFHIDFDPPRNFKNGEEVIGANESWFIMKKMYADRLIGTEGSVAYHQRMKGVPSDLVHWEDYEKIYNDNFVEFNLLENGHVSFFYENGKVGSRKQMTRQIATREARNQLKDDLDVVNNLVAALREAEKNRTPDLEPEPQVLEPTPYQPPEWQEWMEGDTPKLDWETREIQEELATQKRQRDEIDIETEDEDLEIPEEKRLKCYEGIEDPEDANMIISIENGHPPTHWERRVFDEGWDPEADEDMISWWKVLGKEQREWLLKLRGDK